MQYYSKRKHNVTSLLEPLLQARLGILGSSAKEKVFDNGRAGKFRIQEDTTNDHVRIYVR